MKKNLFAIVFILAGALSISPLTFALEGQQTKDELPDVMYATNKNAVEKNIDKSEATKDDSNIDYNSNIAKDTDESVNTVRNNVSNDNSSEEKVVNAANTNEQYKKSSNKKNIKANNDYVGDNVTQKEQNTYNNSNNNSNNIENKNSNVNVENKNRKVLNKEEALELLNKENNNSNQEYGYMGDENTFNVLKEKGHEGYVFVPDVSTDLGLFVDKNTSEVYVFHPSGSLDLY
ncbi:MAG: hypothetical protein RR561_03590 [Peptostreptococcus sp.]|uniref:hypothetical protein n=1 Tax=Peptostreptococcus sp. TaxID=1262 RepID=UPI002FCB9D17